MMSSVPLRWHPLDHVQNVRLQNYVHICKNNNNNENDNIKLDFKEQIGTRNANVNHNRHMTKTNITIR